MVSVVHLRGIYRGRWSVARTPQDFRKEGKERLTHRDKENQFDKPKLLEDDRRRRMERMIKQIVGIAKANWKNQSGTKKRNDLFVASVPKPCHAVGVRQAGRISLCTGTTLQLDDEAVMIKPATPREVQTL